MWIIGLTGAIGAGKTTLSEEFQSLGVPVHCADTAIHTLLESDLEVFDKINALWPGAIVQGRINRCLLGDLVFSSPACLRILEGILYPKLALLQKKFLQENHTAGSPIVVLDVPLLLEVGLDEYCHYVILAVAPYNLRKKRVLERKGMTMEKFLSLESQQMTEQDRRKHADFIIPTGRSKGSSIKKIEELITRLSQDPSPQWRGRWPTILTRGAS
jgi:dephospho-CoA kinase